MAVGGGVRRRHGGLRRVHALLPDRHGQTGRHRFHIDLRHPLLGPLTAYLPVIAILPVAHYASALGALATWLIWIFVAHLAVNAAALFAHWLKEPLDRDAMHPGYFLPVTAGPFIASIGLVSVHVNTPAVAVFGVGIFFWLLLGRGDHRPAVLRLGDAVAAQARAVDPALAARYRERRVVRDHRRCGRPTAGGIGGVTVFMLLVQLLFVRDYLRLPFSTQFWVFTFPFGGARQHGHQMVGVDPRDSAGFTQVWYPAAGFTLGWRRLTHEAWGMR